MPQFESQPTSHLIDYAAVREQVSILRVLELMGWEEVSRHGEQLRGSCPIHKSSSERSRSFSVNMNENVYQCFGCGLKGNQLDLASAYFGISLYQAAIEVCKREGIEVPIRGAYRR